MQRKLLCKHNSRKASSKRSGVLRSLSENMLEAVLCGSERSTVLDLVEAFEAMPKSFGSESVDYAVFLIAFACQFLHFNCLVEPTDKVLAFAGLLLQLLLVG